MFQILYHNIILILNCHLLLLFPFLLFLLHLYLLHIHHMFWQLLLPLFLLFQLSFLFLLEYIHLVHHFVCSVLLCMQYLLLAPILQSILMHLLLCLKFELPLPLWILVFHTNLQKCILVLLFLLLLVTLLFLHSYMLLFLHLLMFHHLCLMLMEMYKLLQLKVVLGLMN